MSKVTLRVHSMTFACFALVLILSACAVAAQQPQEHSAQNSSKFGLAPYAAPPGNVATVVIDGVALKATERSWRIDGTSRTTSPSSDQEAVSTYVPAAALRQLRFVIKATVLPLVVQVRLYRVAPAEYPRPGKCDRTRLWRRSSWHRLRTGERR